MHAHPPHLSLRARATIFVLLVLLIGLAAPGAVMIVEMRKQVVEEEHRAANSLARAVAESVALSLAVGDTGEMTRLADHFLWGGETLFIALYDKEGRLAAHAAADEDAWFRYLSGAKSFCPDCAPHQREQPALPGMHPDAPDAPEDLDGEWYIGRRAVMLESKAGGFDDLELNEAAPAASDAGREPIGWVVAAVPADRAAHAMAEKTNFALLIVLAGWLVAAPIVWLVVRGWSRRLDLLADASERISGGDLDSAITDHGHDDIGRLSASLEQMRRSLQERERELRTFNERLQQEVRQRTRDLEAAKLAAEEANSAKTAFLANMSHEIRTPLTAILGFIDLLDDETRSRSERSAQIETIRRNAKHLLAIINDILDISKIEAGELLIERIETNPAAILGEVVSMTRPVASEKGLDLSLEFRTPMPSRIESDPTRLRQMALNLVSNAIKFTEEGWIRVAASCDPERGSLEIEVADSGIGMGPDKLARLFRPFSQADETMTRRFGGSGLGLAICKRLAEALGGDVEVRSTLGEGSVFTIRLEVGAMSGVRMVTADEAIRAADDTDTEREEESPEGARVLLVEDGPDNRRLISFLLKKAGCEVATAENGLLGRDAALESLRDGRPFDVILLDMQMPVMDGYTAAESLRGEGYTGWIVALTAHAMSQDREKCLAAGCDEYLSKPVDRRSLVETIARLRGVARRAA